MTNRLFKASQAVIYRKYKGLGSKSQDYTAKLMAAYYFGLKDTRRVTKDMIVKIRKMTNCNLRQAIDAVRGCDVCNPSTFSYLNRLK